MKKKRENQDFEPNYVFLLQERKYLKCKNGNLKSKELNLNKNEELQSILLMWNIEFKK